MGGDSRLMRPVRPAGCEVLTPDHLPPRRGEPFAQYALRAGEACGARPGDIIGGASFGGMLAGELARQREFAGLVLLGSAARTDHFPRSYKLVQRLGFLIPDFALGIRSWPPLVRRRFHPIHEEGVAVLRAMAADCPVEQLREFGRMALNWEGAGAPRGPRLVIHGALDAIIPLACAEPGSVIADGGHSLTLTHAERLSAEIAAFAAAL